MLKIVSDLAGFSLVAQNGFRERWRLAVCINRERICSPQSGVVRNLFAAALRLSDEKYVQDRLMAALP